MKPITVQDVKDAVTRINKRRAEFNEITDDEAMFWLDANILSFRIGNDKRLFSASFNVGTDETFIGAVKEAMMRLREKDENETK